MKYMKIMVASAAAVLPGCNQPPGQYAMGVHEVYANDVSDIQHNGLLTGLYCARPDDPLTITAADAKCPR